MRPRARQRSIRFATRMRAAGFSLLEILMALAIFSVGILEVLAIFPAAVINGARAVRGIQARILERTAIAEIEYQLHVPYVEGMVASAAAPTATFTVTGAPGWAADRWQNYYVAITDRLDTGTSRLQQFRIVSNMAASITANGSFTNIQANDHYRITALGLPLAAVPESQRTFQVENVDITNIYELVVRGATSWPAGAAPWNDGVNKRFFVVFTRGEARGKPYRITGSNGNALSFDPTINFIKDGVRSGDEFVIIGCDIGVYGSPTPNFGTVTANTPQTIRPPHLRSDLSLDAPYTYAVIWSDCYRGSTLPASATAAEQDTVRLDVFVFFHYDPTKLPGLNKKPIAHTVHYLGRR